MIVTLFDYGAGNLHSLAKALEVPGATVRIEPDPRQAIRTDLLVLPGVGAFQAAAARLAPGIGEVRAALRDGLPCVGICLGMQLLFDESDEGEGTGRGLGVVPGRVERLRAQRGLPDDGMAGRQAEAVCVARLGHGDAAEDLGQDRRAHVVRDDMGKLVEFLILSF